MVICQPLHITADKREIKDFPKFAYRRTSFIRRTLSDILLGGYLKEISWEYDDF